MQNIIAAELPEGQPVAPPATPFMRAEAVKRAYILKLQKLLADYDREIGAALSGLNNDEYRLGEEQAYRWRLTRRFRQYFRPWDD